MPYKDIAQQKAAQQDWYRENRSAVRDGRRARRARLRQMVDDLKRDAPCMDCVTVYPPYVTDYHHRDPLVKSAGVAKLVGDLRSEARILVEIAKCDLLCANCHRVREYKDNPRFN